MSSNKSPGNTRQDNTGGAGHSSSKQGHEQQSEAQGSSQVDQAAEQGRQTGQARKDGDEGSGDKKKGSR